MSIGIYPTEEIDAYMLNLDVCQECEAMDAWFQCECGRSLCAECFYHTCDCEE